MKITVGVVFALVLAWAGNPAYADPPGRVARLNLASGAVSFAATDAPGEWTQAIVNRPLIGGDRLWADQGARAELHVGSTAIRLASLTSLDLLHLDDERLQLRLAEGTTHLRVRDLDANETVEIVTATGTVIVRAPGSYRVSTDPGGHLRATVHFGEARIAAPGGSYVVPAGQSAVFAPGYAPSFEVAAYAEPDAFDRWASERDRREDAVVSTRYVSPHMTGYEDLDHHGSWRNEPEYGAVWVPARVDADWAPYRDGHWAWIAPWGWTWIDRAPWGFAPFHYGRWVRVHDHWAWAPGPLVRRPVYAPALVAFVGGSNGSVTIGSGPAVGWFPLGWREPYRPWYRASHAHVHRLNVTYVTHVNHIYRNDVRHAHRGRPDAVTVVRREDFAGSRPVSRLRFRVAHGDLARAEVLRDRPPAERERFVGERAGERPPARAARVMGSPPPNEIERAEDRRERRVEMRAPHTQARSEGERRAGRDVQNGALESQAAARAPRAAPPQPEQTMRRESRIERGQGPRERTEPAPRFGAPDARPEAGAGAAAPRVREQPRREFAPRADGPGARERPPGVAQRAERRSAPEPRVVPQSRERPPAGARQAAPFATAGRQAPEGRSAQGPRAQQRVREAPPRAQREPQRRNPREAAAPHS